MKRLVLTALTMCAWWGLDARRADAQVIYTRPQTSPFYQPPVSPYLNILRGGPLGPATGYYTLTRPQLQFGNQLQNLQFGLLGLQQQQAALLSGGTTPLGLPAGTTPPGTLGVTTGHPVGFFNYGRYYTFPNLQGRGLGR